MYKWYNQLYQWIADNWKLLTIIWYRILYEFIFVQILYSPKIIIINNLRI